jgi:hypothetical protein
LNQNAARWQASLREDKAPAEFAPTRAPSGATVRETTVSFGLPAVCNDRFNYRLDSAINLLRGGNRLFDAIDHFQYITALLLSFRFFTLHFSSNFAVVTRRSFPYVSSPFLPFSLESEAIRES